MPGPNRAKGKAVKLTGQRRQAKNANGLTDVQQLFVSEYATTRVQWQAMMRAHGSDDPTEKQWRSLGWQAMQLPQVKAAVEAELKRLTEALQISAKDVLLDIQRIASKAEDADDFQAALKARELLGKHLKLFTDKVELSGNVTIQATPADERL